MINCPQPGCAGKIVDGYCDICGSPGPESSPGSSVAGASPTVTPSAGPASVVNGSPCGQAGCTGQILDGYCDVCGSPVALGSDHMGDQDQPGSSHIATASSASLPGSSSDSGSAADDSPGAGSTITRGSSMLGSTALGSSRATASGSKVTRRLHSGSVRLRAARLGAGLTRVPPAPEIDAAQAVMANAEVPESKRMCPHCGSPVGRSRDGQPGRAEGFCAKCGNAYSFTPKLEAGDLVAGQYEVAGCLAHGGLGWIYLARDRNVSGRWVVLKGLLNTGDQDALAVAIAERQFLAQVEHPLIVEIYNFVTHDDGSGEPAGYIVMEYVGGTSLKQILKDRMRANMGQFDPLPVDQALAYILEVLPAFQYLHDLGLAYCDFKPDNLIQVGDAVKLIDLGGVRRIDDTESAIYGTIGYQAPEVARVGTTVASDIYTIGRTLMVLISEFRGYQTRFVAKLPSVADTPVFQQHDSLYRLIAKACSSDPADRFASIDELRVQLLGVLREVVAEKTTGTALTSAASVLFESPAITSDALEWDQLPALRPDTADPQFGWLSNISIDDPQDRLTELRRAPQYSPEIALASARAGLELDRRDVVESVVADMLARDPWEWRAVWISGLAALNAEDFASARSSFNAVYGQVPGELAAKLALALACERSGQGSVAEGLYRTCAGTDANYVAPAAFGMARVAMTRRDLAAAVAALDRVPSTSRGYAEARRLRAVQLYESDQGLDSLAQAMSSLDGVQIERRERDRLTASILHRALDQVTQHGPETGVMIGPYEARNDSLRDGLETTYRQLASSETDTQSRYALVDQANAVRKWTLR